MVPTHFNARAIYQGQNTVGAESNALSAVDAGNRHLLFLVPLKGGDSTGICAGAAVDAFILIQLDSAAGRGLKGSRWARLRAVRLHAAGADPDGKGSFSTRMFPYAHGGLAGSAEAAQLPGTGVHAA